MLRLHCWEYDLICSNTRYFIYKTKSDILIGTIPLCFAIMQLFIQSVTQHILGINIKNSATCFGPLNHHQVNQYCAFVFGLMIVRRIFNIDYEYMLRYWLNKSLYSGLICL